MISVWIIGLVVRLIDLYSLVIVVDAILSWVVLASYNPTVRRIYGVTNQLVAPLLNPIRRTIYPLTRRLGIDISPLVAILVLRVVSVVLEMLI
jgi:uncharacterized protein YggT (Ycf19 family)